MQWYTILLIPAIILGLWLYTSYVSTTLPVLQGKRICLLIAHPDDEAMFFAPTLLALTKPELGNHVKIVCMSSGNADGLGETRKKELLKSAVMLGLRSEADILSFDDPNYPDSMTTTWHPRLLSNLLTAAFAPKMSSVPASEPPVAALDAIITFDSKGVSSHTNHISLYHGSVSFLKALMHRHVGWECPVSLYTLTSVNVVRKYIGAFDGPLTMLACVLRVRDKDKIPGSMFFLSGPGGYRKAQRAMTTAHQSQMRWFRWGWIGVGRYMVVNDLKRVKVV